MKSIKKEKIHREGEKQRKKKARKQESKKARKQESKKEPTGSCDGRARDFGCASFLLDR